MCLANLQGAKAKLVDEQTAYFSRSLPSSNYQTPASALRWIVLMVIKLNSAACYMYLKRSGN